MFTNPEENAKKQSSFAQSLDTGKTASDASHNLLGINSAEIFNEEQRKAILDSCVEELWMPCKVVGDNDLHVGDRQKLKGEPTDFPFTDIRDITKQANDEVYDFKLLGIIDQDYPQVFKYEEGGYYGYHIDINPLAMTRKISWMVILEDTDDNAKNIKFLNTDLDSDVMKVGNIVVWPSFLPWQIEKIEKGSLTVAVGHIHGAAFR